MSNRNCGEASVFSFLQPKSVRFRQKQNKLAPDTPVGSASKLTSICPRLRMSVRITEVLRQVWRRISIQLAARKSMAHNNLSCAGWRDDHRSACGILSKSVLASSHSLTEITSLRFEAYNSSTNSSRRFRRICRSSSSMSFPPAASHALRIPSLAFQYTIFSVSTFNG